MFAYMDVGC